MMRFAAGLLVVSCWVNWGVGQEVIPLWPEGKIPLKSSDEPEKILESKDDIVRVTNVNVPTLTFYPAPDKGRLSPAVLICPGGGYSILAWNHEGTEIAQWFNAQGLSAFILKYRVPKNRDAAFCDAQRAMGLIRQRAATFRVAPEHLGIMGFSAGAHLSVRVSTNYEKRYYAPVDAADEHSCRPDFALIIYPAYLTHEKDTMDPALPVTSHVPPTFLIQAMNDKPYIDSSLAYAVALKNANVPVELHVYPTGGHGYGMRTRGNPTDVWPTLAQTWLLKVTQ